VSHVRRPRIALASFAEKPEGEGGERLLSTALTERGACPECDDTHSGAGRGLLGSVKGEAGGHGDDEVEQKQEPEDWCGGDQRLHGFLSN